MWVAEADGEAVGFVTATLHHATGIGEIYMPAVDPRHQGGGIGTALTETARNWFQASGMRVAMIETGGGPGHTPRSPHLGEGRLSALPVVRFFKALLD